jgi:signal transduction histidine kinase
VSEHPASSPQPLASAQLAGILGAYPDPVVVLGGDGAVRWRNARAAALFHAADAAEGARRAVQINTLLFQSHFGVGAQRGREGERGAERTTELHLVDPADARDLLFEVSTWTVATPEERLTVAALRDVTKLRRSAMEREQLFGALERLNAELEERVRAAVVDLEQRNRELEARRVELVAANRTKGEFLASMSHELRTPINAVLGYTGLLLDRIYGSLTAEQEMGLRRVRSAAEQLLALVTDVLDVVNIDAGKMPLQVEDVPLAAVMADLESQLDPLARGNGLALRTELAPGLPALRTDREKLWQILLNLLGNAVKFTTRGAVVLRVEADADDAVRFVVRDTGIGIRAEDLDAIWEDFRQVDQSHTREHGGTGLGLGISRRLATMLGGSIGVESEHGVGTTFTLRIPATIGAPDALVVERAATPASGAVVITDPATLTAMLNPTEVPALPPMLDTLDALDALDTLGAEVADAAPSTELPSS